MRWLDYRCANNSTKESTVRSLNNSDRTFLCAPKLVDLAGHTHHAGSSPKFSTIRQNHPADPQNLYSDNSAKNAIAIRAGTGSVRVFANARTAGSAICPSSAPDASEQADVGFCDPLRIRWTIAKRANGRKRALHFHNKPPATRSLRAVARHWQRHRDWRNAKERRAKYCTGQLS